MVEIWDSLYTLSCNFELFIVDECSEWMPFALTRR